MATKKEKLITQLVGLGHELKGLKTKTVNELEELAKPAVSSNIASPVIDMEAIKEQLRQEIMNEMANTTNAQEIKEEVAPVAAQTSRSDIDRNRLIPIMNITNGGMNYVSRRTGAIYSFDSYGDVEYIEFGELLTMRTSYSKLINEPWILIMDDEVVEFFGLNRMYSSMPNPENIDALFQFKSDEFEEIIKSAPRGIQQLIISRAKKKVDEGTFDSFQKIRFLEDFFKIDSLSKK